MIDCYEAFHVANLVGLTVNYHSLVTELGNRYW